MKTLSDFESKILASFSAALLVVVGLSATTWKLANDAAVAATWVENTHKVLIALAHVRGEALQVELSTQNYRISGDPARIVERDAAIAGREAALLRIQLLTAGNASQQERLVQLRQVASERVAISRRTEFLRKTEGLEAANAYVASAPLKETRERAFQLLGDMVDEENRQLENNIAEQRHTRNILVSVGALVGGLLFALLTATYVLIRRQLRETEASRRALAENEENLSVTLRSIGDAVISTDTEGRITRMNPAAERLTGWHIAQVRGRTSGEVFHIINEQTRAPAPLPVATVLATGQTQGIANHKLLVARDGSECPIANRAGPMRDAMGRVSGVVLVFRDVLVERQAERTIREQNEQLEQRVRERSLQLSESEEHLRSVIGNIPAMIAYVDAQGRYVYVNQQYRERFAPGRTDIAGCTVHEVLGDERYAVANPLIDRVLQGLPQYYDLQAFPGVWEAIHYMPKRDVQGMVVGYYVLGNDITERKQAEEEIKTLNANLARHVRELEHVSRTLRTLSAGNRATLRATDEQGLLESMCEAILAAGTYNMAVVWYKTDDAARSLRLMAESGYPGDLDALHKVKLSWADNEHNRGAVATAVRTGQTHMTGNMQADPNYALWRAYLGSNTSGVACPLRVGNEVIGALAIYSAEANSFGQDEVNLLTELAEDMTFGIATLRGRAEHQKVLASMNRLMRYDTLTGLPNEAQFTESIVAAIATGHRSQQPFALLQTNIERLNEINDALGFSHGDQVLRQFAARLSNAAPAFAVVARLRGDEFAMLLPDCDANAAIAMARRLEGVLAQQFPIGDISIDLSAKIGVILFPDHGVTPHDLFRRMDTAVQQAKKRGVGHVVFDPAQNMDQPGRLTMAGDLRRAIEGGDLLLYLQPKVEMATGRVCGAEGLARWKHAVRGLILPGEFIGLAEQTGLIKPLTEWAIETALRLNHAWERQGCATPIAINLSAHNLRDEGLLQKIQQLQATWALTPGLLEAEITESVVMDNAEFAVRVLRGLREEGIALYIDDFGTGYSSLSYLQKLPVEYIKIDQSFVSQMSTSKDSALIVRSTIDLAHDLGRKVVAEGVETQAQWDQLAAFGCDIAQGYFIARPMASDEFLNWVRQFRLPVTTPYQDKTRQEWRTG